MHAGLKRGWRLMIPGHHPWCQTASGRAVDLIAPTAAMIDFSVDIAEGLARCPRFNGQIRSGPYSVAQHSVMGADALWRASQNPDLAAAFLLHDAHEAYVGDITTPVQLALASFAGSLGSQHNGFAGLDRALAGRATAWCTGRAIKALIYRLDRAIYSAAGLAFPLGEEISHAVDRMDRRMLLTERRWLLKSAPQAWPTDAQDQIDGIEPIRLLGKPSVWPWPDAADEFLVRLARWLPHLALPGRTVRRKRVVRRKLKPHTISGSKP